MAYELSDDATEDLREIVRYTVENWGEDAIDSYVSELLKKLDVIGRGAVVKEHYKGEISNLFVSRFRFHQIFYFDKEGEIPKIARILHDKQDRVRHLNKSISKLNWVKGDNPIKLK